MNKKNNRRRRDSVSRIQQAFVELLQDRELKDISVSLLCQKTALNRSTFYANYQDIYALADAIRDQLWQEVMDLYGIAPDWSDSLVREHDYLRLFYHMRDNQLFYRTYFKLGYDGRHTIQFYDRSRARSDFNEEHIDYHLEFFQAGFNAIVKKWLAGGCRESPEEMEQILKAEYRGR